MVSLCIWCGIFNICGDLWSNGVGKNRKIDEEHDEDCVCVEKSFSWREFQLAKSRFNRDGEVGREARGMGNSSINIWDGSELELAWSKESSSYFEDNFPIFLLSVV